jgi:hypothetical protein
MNMRSNLQTSALVAGLMLIGPAAASAQQPVPIYGVTAEVALKSTVEASDHGAHVIVEKTVHGFEHLFHATEQFVVHALRRVS